MNLLGAVRLSDLTEETTSPTRQREQITLTAGARGDTLVSIAEDLDVSGAVSPFDRPGLGPWLTEIHLVSQWDGLIVAKLDRLTRSLFDFQRIIQFCQASNKTLISVGESIDFGTPVGRLIANILVMFAEFERERMRERRRERAADDRRRGWYGGGVKPFGWKAVKVDAHWELRPDPAEVAVIERMARDVIAGKSSAQIARELIAEHVPTQRGGKWTPTTILDILRDPRCPISAELWGEARAALDGAGRAHNRRYDASALLGIAYCAACDAPLWSRSLTKGGREYRYYRCSRTCGARSIPQDALDDAVDVRMVETYGWAPRYERRLIPGAGKARRIAEIDKQIDALNKDADDYPDRWAALQQERRRVKDEPAQPDRYEMVPTGQTVAEYWQHLGAPGRRQFLLTNGVRAYAAREADGDVVVVIEGGELHAALKFLQGT